jgi:flagellar FliL protein
MANPEQPEKTEAEAEAKSAAPKKGALKWVLLGVGAFVLVTLSQAIAPVVTQTLTARIAAHEAAKAAAAAEAEANGGDEAAATNDEPEEKQEDLPEPIYTPLNPPLIVNFANDENGFMQVELQVMARDEKVIEAVKTNAPAIRNALLMLYAGKTREDVSNREGKEKLREETLAEVKRVVDPYTGEHEVEDVYFTSLIAQ